MSGGNPKKGGGIKNRHPQKEEELEGDMTDKNSQDGAARQTSLWGSKTW